jgi:hypothetical protein
MCRYYSTNIPVVSSLQQSQSQRVIGRRSKEESLLRMGQLQSKEGKLWRRSLLSDDWGDEQSKLPDVPTAEPTDDGPSPKKQKPNDEENL